MCAHGRVALPPWTADLKQEVTQMRRIARSGLLLIVLFSPFFRTEFAQAQARDTVANLRTRYNTAKTNAKPQGDLKRKLDEIDQNVTRAARLGRTGELRRLYTEGITLSQGRPW